MSNTDNGESTKFSSRVLNMKFMRKAHETNRLDEEDLKTKKLQDLSEWKLPKLSTSAKKNLVNKPKIKKVGYAAIMNEETSTVPIDGRKKWGEPDKVEVEDEVDDTKRATKSQKESKEFFNSLWKNQRKEDDSILDSLNGGISGAGGSAAKRKFTDNNNNNNQHTNKKKKY